MPPKSVDDRAATIANAWFILALCCLGCAGQVPPSGGPVDLDPPRILSTYPAPYTTHFQDTRVALEFDEYVDPSSVEGSIFISPHVERIEYDWSGKEVEILFAEPLQENRTYVVNVGTDVKDLNNKNRMAQAFTLAFSTGEEIDRGAISGRVYPARWEDSPEGVMLFAYLLSADAPDTLNPTTTTPDYITQSGTDGEFAFRHIALGHYRVFAMKDEFRNFVYDPEADEFGAPVFDIQLTADDTLHDDLFLRLAKEDTTSPRLLKVTAADAAHLLVEFSEAVDTATVVARSFNIRDTVNNNTVTMMMAAPLLAKPSTVMLQTEPLTAERPYRLNVESVSDLAGNRMNPLANSLAFMASDVPDTARPVVSASSLGDSVRGIVLKPVMQFSFSDFMDKASVEQAISLEDSLGTSVRISTRWVTGAAVEIAPLRPLASSMWHKLTIDLPLVKNSRGTPGVDKPRVYKFETLDIEALSSIEGTVIERNRIDTSGTVILSAKNIAVKEGGEYSVTLPKPGNFSITDLPEGQYLLSAFRDRNGNGTYDAGRPYPFTSSERFAVYPDTLKLRARWPLEGVRVELR